VQVFALVLFLLAHIPSQSAIRLFVSLDYTVEDLKEGKAEEREVGAVV
jgi:hypothetical protein